MMTASQYIDARERLGLSKAGAARWLGVGERTAARWESGEFQVPPHIAKLLVLMLRLKLTPQAVTALVIRAQQVGPPGTFESDRALT